MHLSPTRPAAPRNRSQAGFGLVELMVSVLIGLVILAALVTLFVNSSRNNREMATASSVIENGRFAIELLENDIMQAGYWSTYVPDFDDQTFEAVPTAVPAAVPDPCLAFSDAVWVTGTAFVEGLLGIPLQVYESAAVCAGVVTDKLPGTDMIVVRHAEMCVPGAVTGDGNCEADDPAQSEVFIQAALCVDDLATPYVFARTDVGAAPFVLRRGNCLDLADKRRFTSQIYYVRTFANTPGDGIPTLVRSSFDRVGAALAHQPAVPLIEGVQGLRFELGIDSVSVTAEPVNYAAAVVWEDDVSKTRARNRGDGVPDGNFIRCTDLAACTAAQLMNVTAVKIYVLARSREPSRGYSDEKTYAMGAAGAVGPFNDEFKRHVYTTTVRLPNIAGRRERP
jgi:type IV pilus assembly protein PilW